MLISNQDKCFVLFKTTRYIFDVFYCRQKPWYKMDNNRKRLTVMSYLPKLQITLVMEKKLILLHGVFLIEHIKMLICRPFDLKISQWHWSWDKSVQALCSYVHFDYWLVYIFCSLSMMSLVKMFCFRPLRW